MSDAELAAWAINASLAVYAMSGGADFGGGVWDLLASGPRAASQRALIAEAIAPIWEANHIWMIAAVVLLFTAFPPAYAALSTFLHIPLMLALAGIVTRGAAFVFRSQGGGMERWSAAFSVSSLLTPLFLGTAVGCLASGRMPASVEGLDFRAAYVDPWLAPFPLSIGVFAVCLFAFLAASYLTVEAREPALREDFRRRALASGAAAGVCAFGALLLARRGAPHLYEGLSRPAFRAAVAAVALAALAALLLLARRRYASARAAAALQAALIVLGWGLAQRPYLVYPHLTVEAAAAPPAVLRPLVLLLGAGALLVGPAFVYLYRVFKTK